MAFHIKIGNYRFSKNLGNGSFGKVKLAQNEITGHKVAIKILNKKKIKMQGVFEKVKREIKVLRQFNHPHITKHYEFIDTPSDIFMVIEYASGGELFDLIQRSQRLTEEDARRFFQQILSSIEYSHANKITHRDLKPENLLLDEHNNIKLIDFGLANSMKDSQALKTACGSPNYAAPEVISGRSYGGVEVDIWSLGVILFAMVCGRMPFDDDSMPALFNQIKEGKYQMPNYISSDVEDIINRMLQPNPVKRITMREIKDHPWYLKNLPKYLQDLSLQNQRPSHTVDLEIVKKIIDLNLNLQGKSEEDIIKAIKEKKNTDFCGIYELYYHDKLKKECLNIQQKSNNDEMFGSVSPLTISSPKSSTSSMQTGGVIRYKTFKTLRHKMIHGDCINIQMGITGAEEGISYQQKFQSSHAANHREESSQQVNSKLIGNPCQSLLSSKHNDRLVRIVKKFRAGTFAHHHFHQHKPINHASSSNDQKALINGGTLMSPYSEKTTSKLVQQTNINSGTMVLHSSHNPQHDSNSQLITLQRNPLLKHQRWVFGVVFKGAPIDLLTLSCEVLRLLDIEWQIISQDLKMKCRSRIDENSVNEYEQSLMNDRGLTGEEVIANSNKDEMIKEFLRKNFVKFYINIYKDETQSIPSHSTKGGGVPGTPTMIPDPIPGFPAAQQKSVGGISNSSSQLDDGVAGTKYMLDIHLFKGTVYVFMDFVRKFMHVLTSTCSQCSISNDCASSSNQSSGIYLDARKSLLPAAPNHIHNHNLKLFI